MTRQRGSGEVSGNGSIPQESRDNLELLLFAPGSQDPLSDVPTRTGPLRPQAIVDMDLVEAAIQAIHNGDFGSIATHTEAVTFFSLFRAAQNYPDAPAEQRRQLQNILEPIGDEEAIALRALARARKSGALDYVRRLGPQRHKLINYLLHVYAEEADDMAQEK